MSSASRSRSTKITTAVEFLRDVNSKGYSQTILKKYLMEKRNLTSEEVDVAFLINSKRIKAEKQLKPNQSKKDRDRPEKSTSFSGRNKVQDVTFLLPSKQVEGTKVINEFLDHEKAYCNILECLQKEYYSQLVRYAEQGKFHMSKKEVEEIFIRIPDLLKFHKGFLLDLGRGSNIGRMFVKLFKFFEGYADYMKDCQQTVNKMRKYIQDTRLYSCLVIIGEQSARPNDDMVDLILTPLNRMLDYRDFLNTLLSWTDKTQTSDYEILGKAARRIGRVSNYIEKYKYGICNQNEMNKVQKFLGDQCDILAPERAIVRRGMMIRRTSGWTGRNKHYVFFLFNDMLLWTNKNGILQNALQLRSCEVMPSSAKNYAHRKFEVVYRGEKHKTLKLECNRVKERNDWYEAIKRTITTAKVKYSQAWSRSESLVGANYKEYPDNLSEEEIKVSDVPEFRPEDADNKRVEQSEQMDDPYNKRYTVTSSFRIQEFKEIDPMGDNLSQISEQDVAFHQERRNLNENSMPSSTRLSPFEEVGKKFDKSTDENMIIMQSPESSISHSRSGSVVLVRKKSPKVEQNDEVKEEGFEFFDRRKKSSIFRQSGIESKTDVKSSLHKFRLDDF